MSEAVLVSLAPRFRRGLSENDPEAVPKLLHSVRSEMFIEGNTTSFSTPFGGGWTHDL